MDRRSFLRGSLAAPSLLAVNVPVAAKPVIDESCYVDWELLDEQRDVWINDSVTSEGFELEVGSERGTGPYLGRIAWWILPDECDDRSRAPLSGVAQCHVSEIYEDASVVSVKF